MIERKSDPKLFDGDVYLNLTGENPIQNQVIFLSNIAINTYFTGIIDMGSYVRDFIRFVTISV